MAHHGTFFQIFSQLLLHNCSENLSDVLTWLKFVRNGIPICSNFTDVISNCWNSKREIRCCYSVSHPLFDHFIHGTLESVLRWKRERSLTFVVANHFITNKSLHRLLKTVWTIIIFKQLDFLKLKLYSRESFVLDSRQHEWSAVDFSHKYEFEIEFIMCHDDDYSIFDWFANFNDVSWKWTPIIKGV